MKKSTFNKILKTDFSELSYTENNSKLKCFHRYNDTLRLYYNYDMNGMLNQKISLELHFEYRENTKDVEMFFENEGLKIKEKMIVDMLSDKAKENIRAYCLQCMQFYAEEGRIIDSFGWNTFLFEI